MAIPEESSGNGPVLRGGERTKRLKQIHKTIKGVRCKKKKINQEKGLLSGEGIRRSYAHGGGIGNSGGQARSRACGRGKTGKKVYLYRESSISDSFHKINDGHQSKKLGG